jgi:hypothetical protein
MMKSFIIRERGAGNRCGRNPGADAGAVVRVQRWPGRVRAVPPLPPACGGVVPPAMAGELPASKVSGLPSYIYPVLAMRGGPAMSGVRIRDWKPRESNTLSGFCEVEFPSGLIISQVTIHTNHGKWWASPPSKPMIDRGGMLTKTITARLSTCRLSSSATKKQETAGATQSSARCGLRIRRCSDERNRHRRSLLHRALLNAAAECRRMINPRPQQLVQCVGVRVELHQADGPLARQGAQNG